MHTIRRRLGLRSLSAGLRTAFDQARITASVAEAATRLPEEKQAELERRLAEEGRRTLADVRNAVRTETRAATGDVRAGLLTDQEIAWQTTLRGHPATALAAVPG